MTNLFTIVLCKACDRSYYLSSSHHQYTNIRKFFKILKFLVHASILFLILSRVEECGKACGTHSKLYQYSVAQLKKKAIDQRYSRSTLRLHANTLQDGQPTNQSASHLLNYPPTLAPTLAPSTLVHPSIHTHALFKRPPVICGHDSGI